MDKRKVNDCLFGNFGNFQKKAKQIRKFLLLNYLHNSKLYTVQIESFKVTVVVVETLII